jgi:hypothetical protein
MLDNSNCRVKQLSSQPDFLNFDICSHILIVRYRSNPDPPMCGDSQKFFLNVSGRQQKVADR